MRCLVGLSTMKLGVVSLCLSDMFRIALRHYCEALQRISNRQFFDRTQYSDSSFSMILQGFKYHLFVLLCLSTHSMPHQRHLRSVPPPHILSRKHWRFGTPQDPAWRAPSPSLSTPSPALSILLPFPVAPITATIRDLTTYLFGAKASASRSEQIFPSCKFTVLCMDLETSWSFRVGSSTDSSIDGSEESVGYQKTVDGMEVEAPLVCDEGAIQNATIFPERTKLHYPYDGGGMKPLEKFPALSHMVSARGTLPTAFVRWKYPPESHPLPLSNNGARRCSRGSQNISDGHEGSLASRSRYRQPLHRDTNQDIQYDEQQMDKVLTDLARMYLCDNPLLSFSRQHVVRRFLSFLRNGLQKRMERLSVRWNAQKMNTHGQTSDPLNKGKGLPAFRKTLTIGMPEAFHVISVLRMLQTPTDPSSVGLTHTTNHVPIYFIPAGDWKLVSHREGLKINDVANSMSQTVMKGALVVEALNSVLRYAVTFLSEYNVNMSQERFTELVEDLFSSEYHPSRLAQC